jgi:hypothetical protein
VTFFKLLRVLIIAVCSVSEAPLMSVVLLDPVFTDFQTVQRPHDGTIAPSVKIASMPLNGWFSTCQIFLKWIICIPLKLKYNSSDRGEKPYFQFKSDIESPSCCWPTRPKLQFKILGWHRSNTLAKIYSLPGIELVPYYLLRVQSSML